VARIFIIDGTQYPDQGPDVTPDQFRQFMTTFLPEMATSEMTTETRGEDTVYRFRKRVGTKG